MQSKSFWITNQLIHLKKPRRDPATMSKGHFEFVFTPKHGWWLHMIKGFFGKITKQMLRGIRIKSKEKLADRIY